MKLQSVYPVCASADWVQLCFQAEDGIRDLTVTGVQTCALPILGCSSFILICWIVAEAWEDCLENSPPLRVSAPLHIMYISPHRGPCDGQSCPVASSLQQIGRASCRERV